MPPFTREEVTQHYTGWTCQGISRHPHWEHRYPPWMNQNNERARTARQEGHPTWTKQRITRYRGHWVLLEKEVPTKGST